MSDLTLPIRKNSLQTMYPPHPAALPKNGVCLWWDLPKEISDEILKFAYGTPDKPISMLDKRAFECLQEEKEFDRDDEDKPLEVSPYTSPAKSPRPTSNAAQSPFSAAHELTPSTQPRQYERYIDRMLVGKKWHREATAALFASTPAAINDHDAATFFGLNPRVSLAHQRALPGLDLVTSVHITRLAQAPRFARLLATQCPRLRHLRVHDKALGSAPSLSARRGSRSYVHIWQGRWTEAEVGESPWFGAMRVLSGLGSVSLVLGEDDDDDEGCPSLFRHSAGEMEVLRANVGLAEKLLAESATGPRDDPAALLETQAVCRPRVPALVGESC